MYTLALFVGGAVLTVCCIKPFWDYFRDAKGLRRYPNYNALCAISNIGWCLETWRGGIRSKSLSEMHKRYPVIRIGPNSLSYGDPDAIKDIYGHGSKCVKDTFYQTEAGSHFNLGNVIDKQDHARKRKMLSGSFAMKNIQVCEHKVAEKVMHFIEACDKYCTAPLSEATQPPDPQDTTFDFRAWSNFFTIDIILDIVLSENLGLLRAGNDLVTAETTDGIQYRVPFRDCLHASKIAHTRIAYADGWYWFNSKYTTRVLPSYRKIWNLSQGWADFVNRQARKRLARTLAGEHVDDFFQCLMYDKDGVPRTLDWGEIASEIGVLLDAGSATTAIALNNVLFWLLRTPTCLIRLREEIDTALGPDTVVAPYEKVKHLPYLRACLDESLRITPPFSYNLPRRTPSDGATILGSFVPGNTTVSISSYVIHHTEHIFAEPGKFMPERWLGEDGRRLQSYFVPFSSGTRACIGRNLTYLEQSIMLATVVHRYEFALPHPEWEQDRVEVTNLLPGPLPIKVWRRELT
ncbi:Cytochrome P450 [Aspergillus parasiticus SU-1]|uniref:Cytochrome P450 monooxygenase n=2 Tax=Aspergillus parasiticus TaxID=5067 RepID=A0A5N6DPC0_ASPPA|nr:cytochrome P450 monooxygenase [Aspergillus parasiticus]KJK63422.1 Cytochrome P450 [Aspergillus parasiticus SU-1]